MGGGKEMINFYKKLHECGMSLTVQVTDDGRHVRYSWTNGTIPGGVILSFWELENLSTGAVERRLMEAFDDWFELFKKIDPGALYAV